VYLFQSPSHPLWVGAWWIGFLLAGAMAFACAIFVGSYPPVLPNAEKKKPVHLLKKMFHFVFYSLFQHTNTQCKLRHLYKTAFLCFT
jgi:hypothetical protein